MADTRQRIEVITLGVPDEVVFVQVGHGGPLAPFGTAADAELGQHVPDVGPGPPAPCPHAWT